jgi:hypothetical protein
MKRRLILLTALAIAVLAVLSAPGSIQIASRSYGAHNGSASDLKAGDPTPPDGAEGIMIPLLQWQAGDTAAFHDVYFGTNPTPGAAQFMVRQTFAIYWHAPGVTPGTTYYWRIDEVEADGTTIHKGDVWSFTSTPLTAYNPEPPDGAKQVDINTELSWSAGFRAIMHKVYFGTDEAAVADDNQGTLVSTQTTTTYDPPGKLTTGTPYYWRVDEFDGTTWHKGDVWNFLTVGAPQKLTYYVDGTNGSDKNDGLSPERAFATVQKGIDSAKDGDTITVYPGVYREQINFLGKAVTLRSAEDAAVLEAPDDFAVSFYMGEGPDSILENFVVRNSFMGIFIVQSSPTIANVTVVNNKYGIEAYAGAEPSISNSIFWHNSGDDLFGCQARYTCIERGGEGQGNLSADPMFVDAENGDYHLRSQRGRYWPEHDVWVLDKVTSPCIDSGDPTADYSEEPRPNGERINMGAYGGTAYASLNEMPYLDCDTNRDGVVDMTDFALLAENWLGRCWAVPNQPPEVNITAPADGAVFYSPETIEIKAEATDVDGYVVKVEFFADGNKIGQDTDWTDGWASNWSGHVFGSYRLVALATDDDGAVADSTAIRIEINESAPRPPRRR